eukprot:maker-scaffold201_size263271-snap-gene-0.9 protein:Tk08039 transcript:maker-scaffold201_size263271-snap-gene-0.9-mRNA-1 annotation:"1-acyl-sn-glycerol-3-phosphate acyltransferase alpha-like"
MELHQLAFLVIPVIYDLSASCRYFFRIGLYYTSLVVVSSALIPIVALRPKNVRNMVFGARIMGKISTYLLGLNFQVQPNPHLAQDRTFVIVVNHQHAIDCTALAKLNLLYFSGSFGLMAYLSGTTFINRLNRQQSRDILAQAVLKAKESNTKVLVFPEGTRNHQPGVKDLLPFRSGAFLAAIQAQVPILPVLISHYDFLDTRKHILEPSVIKIHVLDPIPTQGMDVSQVEHLSQQTRDSMLRKLR